MFTFGFVLEIGSVECPNIIKFIFKWLIFRGKRRVAADVEIGIMQLCELIGEKSDILNLNLLPELPANRKIIHFRDDLEL